MIIHAFQSAHIEDAARIALDAYRAEKRKVESLPPDDGFHGRFAKAMAGLADGAAGLAGFAATEGGRLLGFLAGYPVDTFFGSRPGVYVPLAGHGSAGPDRRLVCQRLYEAASAAWVREGRLTHCLSMPAHDREALDAWYWLGFGLRCVDAVRPLAGVDGAVRSSPELRKAAPEDADLLYPLHTEHCGYYRNAPLFMPRVDVEGGLEEFRQWLSGPGNHLWAAFEGGKPVAYMRICRGGGNTFITANPETYHITGAFTSPDSRGAGLGAALLQAIVDWVQGQGCARVSVDFESFNVYGSRFWMKHFAPFLFSPVRVIDDRIL